MKKLTKDQERFLRFYEEAAGNVSEACRASHISRQTYYHWVNNSDTFKEKAEEVIEGLYDFVEDALLKQVKNGNITAIIFFCKTKMKQRGYIERTEQEHIGAVPVKEVVHEYVKPAKR